MWSLSLFCTSNRFYRTQNNVGSWNDHINMEFSWAVTMAPAVSSTDICNCGVFAIPEYTKLILGLCNINEWWRWHISHTVARFGCNLVCHVTYLPISLQGTPRFELSYRCNLEQPVEFKIVRTEKLIAYSRPQSNLAIECPPPKKKKKKKLQ